MPVRNNRFTIAIEGDGVSPDTVTLRELFDVLSNVEQALAVVARKAVGTAVSNFDENEFTVSLASVSEGSDALTIAVSDLMFRAAGSVSRSIARGDFSNLPMSAHAPLRSLWKTARSNDWNFRFHSDGNGISNALISGDNEILRPGAISGRTTLYGKVHRVGGVTHRTTTFVLLSGERITASLKTKEIAEELGHLLYKYVGIEGEATWDSEAWSLKSFNADKVTEYTKELKEVDALDALERLASAAGDHWDDVDPDEYVSELRAD